MAKKVIVTKNKLSAIGDAIRMRTGENGRYTLDEMAEKILDISGDIPELEDSDDPILNSRIYGAFWDGTKTSSWIRTDSANSFSDPVPALNNGTGSSPFDKIKPWSEMKKIEDPIAGTLVKIPKFYFKWTKSGNGLKIQISKNQQEGFYVCPACMDRGDGNGELDYCYVGRYHCNNQYKSKTNSLPIVNIGLETVRSSLQAQDSKLYPYDFYVHVTIWMLYLVEFANWDSQSMIGAGCGDDELSNNGATDAMEYHTGTTGISREDYGHIQYRYIEDLWANVYDWCDCIWYASGRWDTTITVYRRGYDEEGSKSITGDFMLSDYYQSMNAGGLETEGLEWILFPSGSTSNVEDSAIKDASGGEGYSRYREGCRISVGGKYGQHSTTEGLFRLVSTEYYWGWPTSEFVGCRLIKLP